MLRGNALGACRLPYGDSTQAWDHIDLPGDGSFLI